jgi:hypothetical protein
LDNAANTLVRWGTAGWSLVLEIFVWLVVVELVGARVTGKAFSLFTGAFGTSMPDAAVLVALAVAGGVPLGYLLYQVYYFLFWTGYVSKGPPGEAALLVKLFDCPRFEGLLDYRLEGVLRSWRLLITRTRRSRGMPETERRRKWWINALVLTRRDPDEVIKFRNQWSLLHSCWYWALGQSQDPVVASSGGKHPGSRAQTGPGIARALDRFDQLSYRYDGLGAIMIGHWSAGGVLLAFNVWRFVLARVEFPNWTWLYLFLGFTVAEAIPFWALYRMIWVNRLHLRASIVALTNSFICHFTCPDNQACFRGPAKSESGNGASS